MDLEGKIIRDLGETGGVSKAGREWKKHEYVIETFGEYPRKVKFTVFGDRAQTLKFVVGNSYKIGFDVESREWQDKWFTDVNVYSMSEIGAAPAGVNVPPVQDFGSNVMPANFPSGDAMDPLGSMPAGGEDLPF